MHDYVKVVLPKSYDLVVGDTFQLFYRGVIEAVNPYCYDILALCERGNNFPRYYEFTPQEEGEYLLTINVYGNDKTLLASGSTNLKVHAVKASPEKQINILCVGDSLTYNGIWVKEAHRRLTAHDGEPKGDGLTGFQFIGTCGSGAVNFEGYGGWTWKDYLQYGRYESAPIWVRCKHNKTAADQHSAWKDENGAIWILETIEEKRLKFKRYLQFVAKPEAGQVIRHAHNAQHTEDVVIEASEYDAANPFWNTSANKTDFVYYCMENGFERIDVAYLFLSWNGQGTDRPQIKEFCKNMINDAKQFIDILHSQYPAAQVKLMGLQVPSVNGGMGSNYGAQWPYCDDYGETRFVMELNRAYEAFTLEEGYRDFTEFINISGQFDSEYNMPSGIKPVNTRNKVTEVIGINGVHPTTEGYLQIADAVYRNMVKCFCQQVYK